MITIYVVWQQSSTRAYLLADLKLGRNVANHRVHLHKGFCPQNRRIDTYITYASKAHHQARQGGRNCGGLEQFDEKGEFFQGNGAIGEVDLLDVWALSGKERQQISSTKANGQGVHINFQQCLSHRRIWRGGDKELCQKIINKLAHTETYWLALPKARRIVVEEACMACAKCLHTWERDRSCRKEGSWNRHSRKIWIKQSSGRIIEFFSGFWGFLGKFPIGIRHWDLIICELWRSGIEQISNSFDSCMYEFLMNLEIIADALFQPTSLKQVLQ